MENKKNRHRCKVPKRKEEVENIPLLTINVEDKKPKTSGTSTKEALDPANDNVDAKVRGKKEEAEKIPSLTYNAEDIEPEASGTSTKEALDSANDNVDAVVRAAFQEEKLASLRSLQLEANGTSTNETLDLANDHVLMPLRPSLSKKRSLGTNQPKVDAVVRAKKEEVKNIPSLTYNAEDIELEASGTSTNEALDSADDKVDAVVRAFQEEQLASLPSLQLKPSGTSTDGALDLANVKVSVSLHSSPSQQRSLGTNQPKVDAVVRDKEKEEGMENQLTVSNTHRDSSATTINETVYLALDNVSLFSTPSRQRSLSKYRAEGQSVRKIRSKLKATKSEDTENQSASTEAEVESPDTSTTQALDTVNEPRNIPEIKTFLDHMVSAESEYEAELAKRQLTHKKDLAIQTDEVPEEKERISISLCPSHLRALAAKERMVVSFHDVSFAVGGPTDRKSRCPFSKPLPYKQIINGVSGIMKPGVNAMMGPTGSGKSSLLDILAGRKDARGLSGEVLINGDPMPPNFKRISGYVIQDDLAVGTLTVRENLWFSASMRLPTTVSIAEKKRRVNEVIYDLGLTACADTKVGTDLIRGISGGEKKRACIGMELITAPTVLFLDEPTTGLDASTANAVILLLKKLGNRGRTIILSIHQPRYSIFRLFDTLTLLCKGKLAYHGPYDKVLPYFETLGYHCQEHNNPADFFLDVINGDSTALAHTVEDHLDIEHHQKSSMLSLIQKEDEENRKNSSPYGEAIMSVGAHLAERFEMSSINVLTVKELSKIKRGAKHSLTTSHLEKYATPFRHQFNVLLKRAFRNYIRNPAAFIGTLCLCFIISLVFGTLFYQIDDSPTTGIQNRFGVLFFMVTNMMFGSVNAADIFSKEKRIFTHEYVSGYYMVLPYFLAKIIADLLPMRTIPPLVFSTVSYWLVGLKPGVRANLTFLFFLFLVGHTSTSIAVFFSASFNTFAVAHICITLFLVFSILFAGLLVNVDTVVPWLSWIQYISPGRYAYSALCLNEFRETNFTSCSKRQARACFLIDGAFTTTVGNISCCTQAGERAIYDSLGIGTGQSVADWDLWKNAIALTCIMCVMLSLTYLQLLRTKTTT